MKFRILAFLSFCIVILFSCNNLTFTPRSKNNINREKPSILLFERIVDFRIEQMGWPTSRQDFIGKGIKYYEVFQDFKYATTTFKIIDSNKMIFSFSDHIQDIKNYKETEKVDLHSYGGKVTFYKENDKFLWKLKMNK